MFEIKRLFKEEDLILTGNGTYKLICPDCGLQGGRTEGFILFPETNTSYCHSSHKHFNLLETYALTKKLIKCLDGNDTGEKRRILDGNLFIEVLGRLKEDFKEEDYDDIIESAGIKKKIELPNNGILISEFASNLSHRIKKQNIFFYRGDTRKIVEVGKIKINEKDYSYNGFLDVDSNRFITIIEKYFIPWTTIFTKNGSSIPINKSMSHSTANVVLVADNFRDEMPVINRIFNVQIPILIREKNEIFLPNKGYDKRFLSWLPYNSPTIDNDVMTLEEAKKNIDTLFKEFCFKSEQDKINAIASFITPFIRGLFSSFSIRTPIFIYEANRERAGKDYLAGLTGILYEGYALEEPPISTGEKDHNNTDELKKKLLSAMIYGRKRLHFSNNKGYLNNAVFESVTTSEKWSDRILGKNEIVTFSNELDFSLSGNTGMTLTPDLANRSIFIKLFLDIEDANQRIFENPDLHGWLKNNRNLILSSLYCLVKNWINTGQKNGIIPFASFQEWSKICGGILESAGYGNPCVRNTDMVGIAMDSETSEMKELFELCYSKKPNIRLKKQDIIEIMKQDGDVFGSYNWDEKSSQIKFGLKFVKYVGRVLSDIRLKVVDSSMRTARWEFVFTKEVGNVGNVGNVLTIVRIPYRDIESDSSGKITNITNITKNDEIITKLPIINQILQVKPISDREIQFRDAEECKNIKPNYKEEDLIKWIEDNPNYKRKELYDKFGVGSIKSELNYWRGKEQNGK
jgi:hypothetical protein